MNITNNQTNTKKEQRIVKLNYFNSIEYTVAYCANNQQLEVLDEAFKSAYADLEKCIKDFGNRTESAMNAFSLVYNKNSQYFLVKNILHHIVKVLAGNIEICAYNTAYQDKNQETQESVLAMTRDNLANTIFFYKSFFENENEPMEDKGTILIHEIAHLIGLKSDKETKALDSAECIRNFLLLCLGKVTEDELFLNAQEAKDLEESDDAPQKIPTRLGEHLYNPDQARVPAGSSTGGQWTSDGTNGGNSSDDDDDSDSNSKNKTDDTDSVNENSDDSNTDDTDNTKDAENTDNKKQEDEKTDETEKEKESRELKEKMNEELKNGVRDILKDEGMSAEEIEEKLENISLEEIKEITDRASEKLKSEIEEKLKEYSPILLATTDFSTIAQAATQNNPKNNSNSADFKNTIPIGKEESVELNYDNSYMDKTGIKVSFADSNKNNSQNANAEDIKNRDYKDDPNEGVVINKTYDDGNLTGCWISGTAKFDGFEPNKNYAMAIEVEYKYTDNNGDERTDYAMVFYDTISDDDGTIILERLNILNYGEDAEVRTLSGRNDLFMNMTFHYSEGRVNDVFDDTHLGNTNFNGAPLAKSFNAHTTNPQYDYNNNIVKKGNQGGVITGKWLSGESSCYENAEYTTLYEMSIDASKLTSK